MKIRLAHCGLLLGLAIPLTMVAVAKTNSSGGNSSNNKDTPAPAVNGTHSAQDDTMRLAGEKRFHSNCARCHVSPPKFPPRLVGTIVRHMRVRATLTEEDMRLILRYMSQ